MSGRPKGLLKELSVSYMKALLWQPAIQEVRQPWFATPDAVQDLFESFEIEVAAVLAVACLLIEFSSYMMNGFQWQGKSPRVPSRR